MKETALITGASGGLGEEFARLCAADSMDVILVARSEEKLQTLAHELEAKHGIIASAIAIDLTASNGVDELVRALDHSATPITLLINNAGFGAYGLFAGSDYGDQAGMIDLNISALTLLTHRLLPGMIERKHGRILNVASTAAFQPGPLMAVYYASKAYVLNFSLALSNELQGTGITATCLCPGPTKTGFESRAGLAKSKLFKHGTMDAQTVAYAGYRACLNGKSLITTGILHKLGTFGTRFLPRMTAAAIARRVQSEVNN